MLEDDALIPWEEKKDKEDQLCGEAGSDFNLI